MYRMLLLLLASTCAFGQAQDTTKQIRRLEIGVGYGQMEQGVDLTPSVDDETIRGNTFGLTLRYFDHHLMGLQAELSYVEAGWRETFDELDDYVRNTKYVELLLLTQISVGRGAVQPLLQAGPYLAAPIGEDQITQTFVVDGPTPDYYDADFPFRLNYGLQAGLGLNVQLGRITLQADGRYLVGFNDLVKTGTTTAVISRRRGFGGRVALFFALWD